jgi:hypothetical protein
MADTDNGGRPSVLTPESRKKILSALRCGLSRAAATRPAARLAAPPPASGRRST